MIDVDGVLLLGGDPIPGAGDALESLSGAGLRLFVATNNSTRTREEVARRIAERLGYEFDAADVVTSAIAAASLLDEGDDPVLAVGEPGLRSTLETSGRAVTEDSTAASTVVVGLDRSFGYETMSRAAAAVRRGARFVATNDDATFPTPAGLEPGAGSIVAAIATAGGRDPERAGKPHPPMVRAISAMLGPGPTWVVGDRPETDLALAHAAGWRPILALTGVTDDPETVPSEWEAEHVVDSIADLARGLERARSQ